MAPSDSLMFAFLLGLIVCQLVAHARLEQRVRRLETLYRSMRAAQIRQTRLLTSIEKDLTHRRLQQAYRLTPAQGDEDEESAR